jgi:WD40 repeat protein
MDSLCAHHLMPKRRRFVLALGAVATLCVQVAIEAVLADGTELDQLIQQLGSPKFAEREAATKALEAIGEPAIDALRRAAATSEDAEVRRRARQLIKVIEDRICVEVRRFEGHTGEVACVAFSPDGKRALSGGQAENAGVHSIRASREKQEDNTVRLWDVDTGKELRCFKGHTSFVVRVAFPPDGRRVLTASHSPDDSLRVWDIETGKELRRLQGPENAIRNAAFSPDGRWALTGGTTRPHTMRLWDLESGKELDRFDHKFDAVGLAFSPDGRRALSAGMVQTPPDQSATWLWDVASGKELQRFYELGGHISSVAFSPDGRQILSAGWSETVRLWDVASGRELHCFQTPAMVHSVAFSPDGRRALSAGGGGGGAVGVPAIEHCVIQLWDLKSGEELRRFRGHQKFVLAVTFSPDGRFALSGSADQTLRLWRLPK